MNLRLYRLLAIVIYLLNRNKVTAKELADYFEVSVRSIYRDLDLISEAGIPIIAFQGSNGGFGISDHYKLDKQFFTNDEISSILLSLKGLHNTIDNREINDIIEKINLVYFSNDTHLPKQQKYYIDLNPWGMNKREKEKLKLLEKAIENNQLISFSYTNLDGNTSTRVVEPMNLILKGTAWYMYGYCRLREDFRIFKVYRIDELSTIEECFNRKNQEFNETMIKEEWENGRETIDIVFKFSNKAKARVHEWFYQENISEENETLMVNVSYPEDEWLYHFILSFGEDIEVLEPVALREKIKKRAEKIFNIYK